MTTIHHKAKFYLVGGPASCGKTRLCYAICGKEFSEEWIPTIFETYAVTDFKVDGKRLELDVCDTAALHDYERLRKRMYPEADVVLLCFSVRMKRNMQELVDSIERFVSEIRNECPNLPYLLVATMKDLRNDPKIGNIVTPEEGKQIAKKIGAYGYLECSAFTREGVVEVFTMAARIYLATKGKKDHAMAVKSESNHEDSGQYDKLLAASGTQNKNLVERHIQQQGCVPVLSLKSFFIGPSCVGKTTARRRLTHEIDHIAPDEIVPSTGIEAPLTVQLYHETKSSSVLLSEWRSQGLEEQCRVLCSHILNSPPSFSSSSNLEISSQSLTSSTPPSAHAQTKPRHKLLKRLKQMWKASTSRSPSAGKEKAVLTNELTAALSSLVKVNDWESIREFLKDTDLTLLHIVDIGGQPECHEILPLLLHGLALNLIFFNVTQDLDAPFTVVYRGDVGSSPIQYESEFTIREIIQRSLCSISSLQTGEDNKPVAILIGTYLDRTNEAAVLTLDRAIQKAFKDAEFMTNDVLCPVNKPGEEERYIHPLNNVNGDSSDIERLRQIITTIIHKRFTPVPIPTSTLLLHLILRWKYEARGWCTVEECVEVAKSCGISQEDLLHENGILRYLHDKFGTILHYRGLKIGQRVVINANVIMAPTTELFVYAFGVKEAEPKTAQMIRTTGEIPQRLMNKVCSSKNVRQPEDRIPTSEIVELLASRYILYENIKSATGEITYFLPCFLLPDHEVAKEASDPDLLSALFYSPILFLPSSKFVPLSLFPATVVNLSRKTSWTLDQRNRFRNRIRFFVSHEREKLLHVEFRTLSTHLEFRILSAEPINPRLILECRQEVWSAIIDVSSFYPHTQEVTWRCGFYCPHSLVSGGRPHPAHCLTMEQPQDVICSLPDCHGEVVALQDKHKCWFAEIQITKSGFHKKPLDKIMPEQSSLTVKLLVEAVTQVTNWHGLGLQLNLTMSQLDNIQVTYHVYGVERMKAQIFDDWLKSSPTASWDDLIAALRAIGEDTVASRIASSHSQQSAHTEDA